MNITRRLTAAIAIALFAVFLAPTLGFGGSPKAAKLLADANKLAIEAQNTKDKFDQGEKFLDALKAYGQVTGEKRNPPAPEAAQAYVAAGKLEAGVPIESAPEAPFTKVYTNKISKPILFVIPHEGTVQDDYIARDSFRAAIQNFDKPEAELKDTYGTDAPAVMAAVDQARKFLTLTEARIDETNKQKTLYKILDALVALTGRKPSFSYWFAIILLAVIVKVLITPLTKAQFKSMKEMQKVSPLIKKVQEEFKGDQAEIGKRTMDLYKEHGINPLMGCLPILIQMPILYMVYGIIRTYEIQFSHGTFLWVGWQPLVHKWSITLGGKPVWLTAANMSQPDLILLVLYTISMILSQKISIVDPTQAEQQKMMAIAMPVMFFLLIGWLPSAFVLYWFIFNVLQTWQQYHIIHGGTPAGAIAEAAPTPTPVPDRVQRRRRRRR